MTKAPEQSTETPNAVDELLAQLAFGTSLHFQSGLCRGWALKHNHSGKPALHILSYGQAWLTFPEQTAPISLQAGDAIFFTRTLSHWVSSEAEQESLQPNKFKSHCVPDAGDQGLVCYDISVEDPLTTLLFSILPDWLLITKNEQTSSLRTLIDLISQETQHRRPGYETAISRMSDLLVLEVLRKVLADKQSHMGVLGALNDPVVRKVALAIIDNPGGAWHVEAMAEHAFLSRSAFADRVHQCTDMSPKALLDQLRLVRARQLLHQKKLPIDLIAEQVGYGSATAFIRFFKNATGVSPGKYLAQISGQAL